MAASLLLVVFWTTLAWAGARPGPTGLAPFVGLSDTQLASLQVRITYLGAKATPFPSLVLTAAGAPVDTMGFRSFQRAGFAYGKHQSALIHLPVALPELRDLLQSVAALPDVSDGTVDSIGWFSFALLDTADGTRRTFESILNETSALELFDAMRNVFGGNPKARDLWAVMGCGLKILPRAPGGEITRDLMMSLEQLGCDPASDRVSCRARLLNRSHRTLEGPLVMVLNVTPTSVRLLDADGYTCHVFYPGAPYVALPLEKGLAPGEAVERLLTFENPRHVSFAIERRAFVGIEER
jgi:hypothetical protein